MEFAILMLFGSLMSRLTKNIKTKEGNFNGIIPDEIVFDYGLCLCGKGNEKLFKIGVSNNILDYVFIMSTKNVPTTLTTNQCK